MTAVMVSGLACVLLRNAFPDQLRVLTDVVGYPIHANFNVFAYFQNFYILVVLFPLGSLVVYHLLGLRNRRHWPPPPGPHRLEPSPSIDVDDDDEPSFHQLARSTGRLLFNGTVIGLALAFIIDPATGFGVIVAASAAGFAALAAVAAVVRRVPLPGRSFVARLAGANALSVAVTVLLLAGVSSVTRVTVISDGTVDRVQWMPWWLAVAAAGAVLAVVWRSVGRDGSDIHVRRVERRALLFVAAPVGIFLLFARLPPAVAAIDLFHDGEALAPARLLADGTFPWRDLFFIHGLMQDVFRSGIGLSLIQDSHWGSIAGQALLLAPLYWIFQYALNLRLFGRNWLFLGITTVLALNGYPAHAEYRFILQPLLLLLLASLLAKPSKTRAAAFVTLAVADLVITPESAFLVVAAGVILIAFETYYASPGQRFVERYGRTLWCAAFAALGIVLWLLFLAFNGALGSFFLYYRTFAPDHLLTGGIPLTGTDFRFRFAIVVPPIAAVATLWHLIARIRGRRPLAVEDWVMAAVAIFVIIYYQKFLSRADQHVYHVLAVSLPLIYYVAYKAIGIVEDAVRRLDRPSLHISIYHPISLALLAAVIFVMPGPEVDDRVRSIPSSFRPTVPDHPRIGRLGYSLPGIVDEALIGDVRTVLSATMRPGDRVFDMTNTPGLFYYVLDLDPIRRYFHVSMAIRAHTQEDLLAQLRRDRPTVVVLGRAGGLASWDGVPNPVRHYAVSEYVLRNYRPLLAMEGMVFLVSGDNPAPSLHALAAQLTRPISTQDLLFNGEVCNWGFAPNFFADPGGPPEGQQGTNIPFRATAVGNTHEVTLELPEGLRLNRFSRLEIEMASNLVDDSFVLSANPPDDSRAVQFKMLKRSERRYRVRVGACPQWYAFSGPTLSLRHSSPQRIEAVRLLSEPRQARAER